MTRIHTVRRLAVGLAAAATAAVGFAAAAPAHAASPPLTVAYDAAGSSHLGGINADLPIAATTLQATVNLDTFDIIAGTLAIAPQVVSFTAPGSIPVRATTSLTQASPITGKLTSTDAGQTLAAKVSYTAKVSNVQVQAYGKWVSLNIGSNCQTSSPIQIPVATPSGKFFDVSSGGTVVGKYTIGSFKNCATLRLPHPYCGKTLNINNLVPGTNNTVKLVLKNGRFVSGG